MSDLSLMQVVDTEPTTETPAGAELQEPVSAPAPLESSDNWAADLPDEIRNDPILRSIKSKEAAAKSLINATRHVGAKWQNLEGKDIEDYNRKVGIPEGADKYELLLKEGLERDTDTESWYRGKAHELGLTQKQAAGLFESFAEYNNQLKTQHEQQLAGSRDEASQILKGKWGNAYEPNLDLANRTAVQAFGAKVVKKLIDANLGNDPDVLEMLVTLGRERAVQSGVNVRKSPSFGSSPQEAKQQLELLQSDKAYMKKYMDASLPGHKEAFDEITRLFQAANPTRKKG